MFCLWCKSSNNDSDKKCRFCGHNLNSKPAINSSEPWGEQVPENSIKPNKLSAVTPFLFVGAIICFYIPDFIKINNLIINVILLLTGGILLLSFLIFIIVGSIRIKNYWAALIYFVLLLAIIFLNIFGYYQAQDFYSTINKAQTAFQDGKKEDIKKYAELAFTKADKKSNEQMGTAYYWLAVSNYSNYDNAGAEIAGAKAVSFDSNKKPLVDELNRLAAHNFKFGNLINQAQSAWQNNQNIDIIKFSQEALNMTSLTDQDMAIANYWLGVGYYRNNQLFEAERAESISISLRPNNVGPYVTMAAIKLDQNNITEARTYAEKSLEIDSNYAWAQNVMGVVLLRENKPKEAVGFFKRSIELSPNTEIFKNNLITAQNNF